MANESINDNDNLDNNIPNPVPHIFVHCSESFRNGRGFGSWIDATQPVDKIKSEIDYMLSESPVENAKEFEIYSYEDFMDFHIESDESLESVHEKALIVLKEREVKDDK